MISLAGRSLLYTRNYVEKYIYFIFLVVLSSYYVLKINLLRERNESNFMIFDNELRECCGGEKTECSVGVFDSNLKAS